MRAQMTETFQPVTGDKTATVSRGRLYRSITYWIFTVLLVFELVAGSVWNLRQIEWVHIQLNHLGYPLYFAYILGAWQIGGAAAIIVPRFPRVKEWAYAGAFFEFSGAVVSHLLAADSAEAWRVPLVYAAIVIVSWALRPAGRRPSNAGPAPETRPLAWAVSIGILVLMYAVAYLTLPAVNLSMHQRAVDLGWIAR
jgi:heme A synthase